MVAPSSRVARSDPPTRSSRDTSLENRRSIAARSHGVGEGEADLAVEAA